MFKSWQKNTKFWFSRFSTWKTDNIFFLPQLSKTLINIYKCKILARFSIKDSLDSDGIAGQRASYTEVNSQSRGFPDRIKNNIVVTKVSHHIGGHQLWLDLVRNGLHQVYLPMTGYTWMNTSLTFKPRYVEGTGQGLKCAVTLWPHLLMEMMMIIWRAIIWMLFISKAFEKKSNKTQFKV